MAAAPPVNTGTGDLIRHATSLLIRYPRRFEPNPTLDQRIDKMFVPRLNGEPPPVVGVGMGGSEQVTVFLSDGRFRIDRLEFEKFFQAEHIHFRDRYTGPFVPSAVEGGASIGSLTATGTLGCVLTDVSGDPYLLSCNHVIADLNKGMRGRDLTLMPGPHDNGTAADRVGVLYDFEDLHFGGVHPNYMDAAIAKPDRSMTLSRSIPGGIGVVGGIEPAPKLNSSVVKFGKTTGQTAADLVFMDVSLVVPYADGEALFAGQYGILEANGRCFADNGDSGALVVNGNRDAVGLLFCVASVGDVAIMNPIEPILTRFGLNF